jgi:hypothetical protein
VVVGDVNSLLSPIYRSSKQKINKEILEKNDTIHQMDLTDVYGIFHPTTAQYTSSQHPMELSPKQIISWGTKQVSANIRK